jgi:hypothetical protein
MAGKESGKKAASNAGKILGNKQQDKPSKSAAGSALSQRPAKRNGK